MDIRSERLLVLKHNPCSDHVRAPLIPPMNIVRIKYSSVYLDMNFFETYEFSPQLTTRSSRKPISSPRRKGLDVLDLPPDIQPHSRRSTSRTIIVSKIVHGKTLHKFGACNCNLEEDDRDGFSFPSTKLLPVAQMGVVGRSHYESSWTSQDISNWELVSSLTVSDDFRTRFSGEIELRYLIGKTLMEPLSYASSE
ncbi:hypothetical protein YC2023_115710 [Brassica napus]